MTTIKTSRNNLEKVWSKTADILDCWNYRRSKIVNYSSCETAISNLLREKIHLIYYSQLCWHKNIENLKLYHTASTLQQKHMSYVLSTTNNDRLSLTTCISVADKNNVAKSSSSCGTDTTIGAKCSHAEDIQSIFGRSKMSNCIF